MLYVNHISRVSYVSLFTMPGTFNLKTDFKKDFKKQTYAAKKMLLWLQ